MTKPSEKPKPQPVHGGYQPKPGPRPKLPTTGSGVNRAPAKKQEIVVHQPQQPKSLLQVIAEAAANPSVDVQKMKELLAIQREIEQRDLERIFNEALTSAKAEMPRIVGQDRKAENYHYATLEKVSKSLDKIIEKHGFVVSYGMAESSLDGHYRITAKLRHKCGFSSDYFIDLPADTEGPKGGKTKTAVQGIGSTVSYGRRYLKLMIFDIVVGREDDDGLGARAPEKITEKQAEELLRLCAEKNIGGALFSQAFGVGAIADLPASKFDQAKARLTLAPKQQPKKEEQLGES